MSQKKKNVFLVLIFLFITLFFMYLGLNANFYQNDDWVYRLNVWSFLNKYFTLFYYTGPTFYVQGFIGLIWSKIFGISSLPLLTALVTSINAFLFLILLRRLNLNFFYQVIAVLIFAFNPINVYLSIGFMTGQYFMLFFLLSILLFYKYLETNKLFHLFLLILVSFLGLLTRQVALIIPLSFVIYNLFKRNLKRSLIGVVWFITFYLYLNYIFPKTPRMIEVPLQFHHLLDFEYTISLVYGVLIMLVAFLLPLFLFFVVKYFVDLLSSKKYRLFAACLLISAILSVFLNFIFKPEAVSWGEFPYFENTFERTGFYPRGFHGTKYHLRFNYDLYFLWDLIAKTLLAATISILILNFKKMFSYEFWLIIVYLSVLVVTETFYDRYILPLIPLTILFLFRLYNRKTISEKLETIGLKPLGVLFSLFLIFYSYQLSLDFLSRNNYAWGASMRLVSVGIPPGVIYASDSWRSTYDYTGDYEYIFSYDSPEINKELKEGHDLIESKKIEYPLNLFVDPLIYLYKRK